MTSKRPGQNDFADKLDSPLGTIWLVISGRSLTAVSFRKPAGISIRETSISKSVKKELTEYFEGKRETFSVFTEFPEGTDFEKSVWNGLKEIPYGETRTYKWLAAKIGHPQAFRAVGNALGKNPIPVIFPCHRVIESDGDIGGYSSGIEIKRRLLEMEYYSGLSRK